MVWLDVSAPAIALSGINGMPSLGFDVGCAAGTLFPCLIEMFFVSLSCSDEGTIEVLLPNVRFVLSISPLPVSSQSAE